MKYVTDAVVNHSRLMTQEAGEFELCRQKDRWDIREIGRASCRERV